MNDLAEEQMTMIEDCEHRESRLSAWDAQFIDSIKRQITDGRNLSPLQAEKLDEIWSRVTAKGWVTVR
jgi:hypothetical protein